LGVPGGDGLSRAANGVRGQQTSVRERFGIGNFVYSRRRPFHPQRLMDAIKRLPVEVDMDGHVVADWEIPAMFLGRGAGSANKSPKKDEEDGSRIMHSVLRSKGFVWLANAPQTMHYWSHAGHFFALEALGPWWGATDAREWPHTLDEVQRILDDWYHDDMTTGDRRQEIVFIGVDMDQDAIEEVMDRCLLSDKEMQLYQQHVSRNRVQPAGPTAAATVKANELMRPPPPRAPAALAQK
jgi:G3E family GTPase